MSGESNASGLVSALAQIAQQASDVPTQQDDTEQLAFFDSAPMPVKPRGKSGPLGGRPLGSVNLSTRWWSDYLNRKFQSPLVTLAEMCNRTPHELAEELELYEWVITGHCDGHPIYTKVLAIGEAVKLQRDALIASLPYRHQKLPIAIETKTGEKGGMLIIGEMNITANFNGDGQLGLAVDEPQTIDAEPVKPEPQS